MVNRGEYDLADNLTAFASIGGRQSNYETIAANSILVGNQGDIVNSLARQRGDRRTYSAEVGLRGNFDTGPLRHDWTLSANRLHERLGMVYAFTGMQPGNLYQTSPHTPLPDFSSLDGSIPKTNETDLGGVALADRLSFLEDRVQVTPACAASRSSRATTTRPAARAPATTSGTYGRRWPACWSSRCRTCRCTPTTSRASARARRRR